VVKRFGLPGFTDYPLEIQLNPGDYALVLYCFKSLTKPTFKPALEISVKAGFAYTVKCDRVDGKGAVFASQETRRLCALALVVFSRTGKRQQDLLANQKQHTGH
jgi:hypothetical protein